MNKDEFKELLVENNKTIFSEMDKRFDQMEQKRIDDNFYFEHTYGEKISIIFNKLQLMDDIKEQENKENQKYKNKIEHNEDVLAMHDFRISKLEKKY